MGIGEGVSEELVKGLAKAAKGEYEFIKTTSEGTMETKVIKQLTRAIEPCLRKVTIKWGPLLSHVKQAPFQVRYFSKVLKIPPTEIKYVDLFLMEKD